MKNQKFNSIPKIRHSFISFEALLIPGSLRDAPWIFPNKLSFLTGFGSGLHRSVCELPAFPGFKFSFVTENLSLFQLDANQNLGCYLEQLS
jgi:hypothetical protein